MFVACIVTFNPCIRRLTENISTILPQVDTLLIIDNGSENINEIQIACIPYNNIHMICNGRNLGISKALNQACDMASQLGAEWILTLDQDSVCTSNIIKKYEDYIHNNKDNNSLASLTCHMNDRSLSDFSITDTREVEVDFCITSGNYIKIDVWRNLGKFDNSLFIDKVDTDYCYRLIVNAYKIIELPFYGLLHEIGSNSKRYKFFGKEFIVFNHTPFRCYFIIRNQIYFARKHRKTMGLLKCLRYQLTAWTRIFIYIFFETDKMAKIKAWARGIYNGYIMPCEDETIKC